MARLVFLTLEDRTGFVIDDAIAIDALVRRGHVVTEVPWRRFDTAAPCDGVIVRTPWDYQHDLEAFLALLDRIEAAGIPLENAAALCRWNSDKRYLEELRTRGVATVPTLFGQHLDAATLAELPTRLGTAAWVLKPTVGANADHTHRFDGPPDDATVRDLVRTFAARGFMAQPFVRAVVEEGEISLFYFGGRFSHAVQKRPKSGDFRVQEEHGGHIAPLDPDAHLKRAAAKVLAALPYVPLQARVDLVHLDDGTPALMELEAIEPSLYFRMHPRAADHYADAVESWLGRGA